MNRRIDLLAASPKGIEAPRGMAQTISTKNDWTEITSELGKRFEISVNTYKPFACGIVIHPTIDAAVQLRAKGVIPADVKRVELRVHSLVLELTGKKEPKDGRREHVFVKHDIGSLERPLTDAMLEAKFRDQAEPVIGKAKVAAALTACWKLGEARNVADFVAVARP